MSKTVFLLSEDGELFSSSLVKLLEAVEKDRGGLSGLTTT